MPLLAPPPEPPVLVSTSDDDRLEPLRFRLWQIFMAMLTVAATIWLCMLRVPLISIISIAVAKHVLVAILVMGLERYPVRSNE